MHMLEASYMDSISMGEQDFQKNIHIYHCAHTYTYTNKLTHSETHRTREKEKLRK